MSENRKNCMPIILDELVSRCRLSCFPNVLYETAHKRTLEIVDSLAYRRRNITNNGSRCASERNGKARLFTLSQKMRVTPTFYR